VNDSLADALGERLIPHEMFRGASTLHIVLDEPLTRLPVAALRGSGKPLIAVRPVLRLLRFPGKGDGICSPPDTAGRATVLADGAGDLPGARQEAVKIAKLLDTTALVGKAATSAALLAAKSGSLLHVATHANPDSLRLYDRDASALEILEEHHAFSLVVLAGSSTARSYKPEIGSMATAFLAGGSSLVIATSSQVSDDGAAEVMLRFYEEGGAADPIRKLAAIQAQLAKTTNKDWPNFVMFGSKPCVR
jgi:CHAT domain-containing protein